MQGLRQWLHAFAALVVVASSGSPPTQAAFSISFNDSSPVKGQYAGNVTIIHEVSSDTPFEYRVYFATIGPAPVDTAALPNGNVFSLAPLPVGNPVLIFKTQSLELYSDPANSAAGAKLPLLLPLQGKCLANASYLYSPLVPCNRSVSIPAGVTHLLVRSHNEFGALASTGRWTKIVDWTGVAPAVATAGPLRISFRDTDQDTLSIGGPLKIFVPFPEAMDVASYRIYWHGIPGGIPGIVSRVLEGGRSPWIVEVPATGYNTEAILRKGTIPPVQARRMYVVAVNRNGESAEGLTLTIFDDGFPSKEHTPLFEVVVIIVSSVLGLVIIALTLIKLRFMIVRIRFPETLQKLPPPAAAKMEAGESGEKPILHDMSPLSPPETQAPPATVWPLHLVTTTRDFLPGNDLIGMNIMDGGIVEDVMPGSQAAGLDIQMGWVILEVNRRNVQGQQQLEIEQAFADASSEGKAYSAVFAIGEHSEDIPAFLAPPVAESSEVAATLSPVADDPSKWSIVFSPGPTGMTLSEQGLVSSLLPGSRAVIAGVQEGWRIVEVGELNVENKGKDAIEAAFSGAMVTSQRCKVVFKSPQPGRMEMAV